MKDLREVIKSSATKREASEQKHSLQAAPVSTQDTTNDGSALSNIERAVQV